MKKRLILLHILFFSIVGISAIACSSSKQEVKGIQNYESNNPKLSFKTDINGIDKYFEVKFTNDSISSLSINGERIKNENIDEYEDVIYDKINDLRKKYFFSFTFNRPSVDKTEFKEQMKKLKEELKDSRVAISASVLNDSLIQKNIKKALKDVKKNFHSFHFDFDKEDLQEALANLNDELENLDLNLDIDVDVDLNKIEIEIEEAMKKLGEVHIELNDLDNDFEKLDSFSDALRTELVKDRLIESKDAELDIEISAKKMIVNDEKVSDSLFKKYKQLYKKHFGEELEGKRRFEIHK